jgi:hypothetical protein
MASDSWEDVVSNTAFGAWFDPVSQYEIVTTGYLGTLLGLRLTTDAYREPQLRVLNQGDLYIISTPEFHGAYTDRGPVQSKETDGTDDGVVSRGWLFWEIMSMTVHNGKSIVKGVRS